MKGETHIFQGLRRDQHPIRSDGKFFWDASNIRITSRDSNTTFSITNEKSTEERLSFGNALYVGHSVVGNYLICFLKEGGEDVIRRISLDNLSDNIVLYKGNLDIRAEFQAVSDYESTFVQKVYWVDGFNTPRVINVAKPELFKERGIIPDTDEEQWRINTVYKDAPFEFVQELNLEENVTITRDSTANGIFPAGVIQYAFTYYHKYGQESNIFYTSELLYLSHSDRGASPEDTVSCAFNIEVDNVQTSFDYLRVYSIIRTSIDGQPVVKRVTDIELNQNTKVVYFSDNGTTGDDVDPTRLLYLGGKRVIPKCIASKDNTMFFGDITYQRDSLLDLDSSEHSNGKLTFRDLYKKFNSTDSIKCSTRNSIIIDNNKFNTNQLSQNTSTFRSQEKYRLGIQAQYLDGSWSEPIYLQDVVMESYPEVSSAEIGGKVVDNVLKLPIFYYEFNDDILTEEGEKIDSICSILRDHGYKKIRGIIAKPTSDRVSQLAQGLACPVLKTPRNYGNGSSTSYNYYPSWIFRKKAASTGVVGGVEGRPGKMLYNGDIATEIQNMTLAKIDASGDDLSAEIQQPEISYKGVWSIDNELITMHSPDFEFNDSITETIDNSDTSKIKIRNRELFGETSGGSSTVNIQLETVQANPRASGVLQSSQATIISDYLFEDGVVDETKDAKEYLLKNEKIIEDYLVYMWHRDGSLNNDCVRPVGKGQQTAKLKKKIIASLIRFGFGDLNSWRTDSYDLDDIKIFNSNEQTLTKLGNSEDHYYFGNADVLNLTNYNYPILIESGTGPTPLYNKYKDIGDYNSALVYPKDGIRIKYKSTPHAVIMVDSAVNEGDTNGILINGSYTLFNISRLIDSSSAFRTTEEALKQELWIPAGPAVSLKHNDETKVVKVEWHWGDTWYQRYDCLKTYPYTNEDVNQVIDIASFMCETRVNLDGRYDRNRGLRDYTSVSPVNFNKINTVYSQLNTFFNYRLLDKDYYLTDKNPTQVLYTNSKLPNSEVDEWTNLHLASSLDLEGNGGSVTAIVPFNDTLVGFQEKCISHILFNSRVQIQTSDGVPIEIANSQKVSGFRLFSDSIGCKDKNSIVTTPQGIYFIDISGNAIYRFSDQLQNISLQLGTSYWIRENCVDCKWSMSPSMINGIKLCYDAKYHDVYFIPGVISKGGVSPEYIYKQALCFSEQLGQFCATFDYGGSVMFSYNARQYSIAPDRISNELKLWENYPNDSNSYGVLFGKSQPFSFSYIENYNPTSTKIFDTVEFQADQYPDGYNINTGIQNESIHKEQLGLPFDSIRVNTECQDTGEVQLNSYNLRNKFRVWRTIVPRNKNTRERIRNPWAKIQFTKNANADNTSIGLTIVHNIATSFTV